MACARKEIARAVRIKRATTRISALFFDRMFKRAGVKRIYFLRFESPAARRILFSGAAGAK